MAVIAVWWGALNQDEGWYLYSASMVRSGYLPYRDFFFTQGPALPFVYSVFQPIWAKGGVLAGLLGGRVVTCCFGLLSTLLACVLARRLVPVANRAAAGLAVFALLACNLYHVYFTTIPKTYALGGTFVMAGFLLVARALERGGWLRGAMLFAGALSLAFATGTRISLLLLLPAVGFTLLFGWRRYRLAFLWFGLGGMLGLFLTYGLFALDPASLRGLLAAQGYHAARGGFDLFFSVGSVSRLVRGYAALGAMLFFGLLFPFVPGSGAVAAGDDAALHVRRTMVRMLCWGFAAVFLLQLSAPFPYDDYQVPIMGILTVAIVVFVFSRAAVRPVPSAWFAVLVAGMASFCSPMLQEWATYGQDRFWSRKKETTAMAKLRRTARELEALDPGGTELLTQDLYLAVEAGRTVPRGMEMGPFCYFPDMDTDRARKLHVLNRELMRELLERAPSSAAAVSGYAFAIAVPSCKEVPRDEQRGFVELLKKRYETMKVEENFGQNATSLTVMKRMGDAAK